MQWQVPSTKINESHVQVQKSASPPKKKKKKKNAGKPAYQSPLTNPTKWVFCALGTTLLVINVIQHTSAIFFYLMEFRNCPWYYSPCSNLHQKALIAPPQR